MSELLHEPITRSANHTPMAPAIHYRGQILSYGELDGRISQLASALIGANLLANARVAVYLPKCVETVVSIFGASRAGGVFVPINPLLKAEQAHFILMDCNVRILVTSHERAKQLHEYFVDLPDLHTVVLADGTDASSLGPSHINFVNWEDFTNTATACTYPPRIDTDMTAILYTSGSTGKPKGVVLSHANIVAGAASVARYLQNSPSDRLLAVLPFSFDYGLSQLTTAFYAGASVVLMEYLLPKDVVSTVVKERITGLAGVPTLWTQVASLDWPAEAKQSLRYITSSGGVMPSKVLTALCHQLPETEVYLMYGLTEAFRSSYLPPHEVDRRPDSIGKAIPNAELLVVREDGTLCAPNEPGELVHRGSLVALGYWNDPETTATRFKPVPNSLTELPLPEIAVWSGDTVRMDEEGFLYFIGRKDDMIKTSGYRVSPTEVEEVIYATGLIREAAAVGLPHPILGQAILVAVTALDGHAVDTNKLMSACKHHLANFMVPQHIEVIEYMPKNPNGKIDHKKLIRDFGDFFGAD